MHANVDNSGQGRAGVKTTFCEHRLWIVLRGFLVEKVEEGKPGSWLM